MNILSLQYCHLPFSQQQLLFNYLLQTKCADMVHPVITGIALLILTSQSVYAAEVEILSAQFKQMANLKWSVAVTLRHNDQGWDHFADRWQIVDQDNNILGTSILLHPHVHEQPFTRSLNSVSIPTYTQQLFIEARDNTHGWSKQRFRVDMETLNLKVQINND